MATKVELESLNGKMAHIIAVVMLKAKEMVMANFLILKIKQEVEDFGKMESYKAKDSTFKKARYINAYGQTVN